MPPGTAILDQVSHKTVIILIRKDFFENNFEELVLGCLEVNLATNMLIAQHFQDLQGLRISKPLQNEKYKKLMSFSFQV